MGVSVSGEISDSETDEDGLATGEVWSNTV